MMETIGAGDLSRAWRAIRVSWAVEAAILWPASIALFVFRHGLVGWFTQDPEVAAMAAEYLVFSAGILLFYGFYFVAFRALQAAGDMRSPMLISVTTAVGLGAPMGYYLATQSDLGATGMWAANFAYAIVNAIAMVLWLLRGRWAARYAQA